MDMGASDAASCASSSSSSSSSSPSAHPFLATAATAIAAIRAYIACFFALRRSFICALSLRARRQAHTFVLAMEIGGGDAEGGIGVGGRWTFVLLSGALAGCKRWNQVETKRPRARRQKDRMCRKSTRKMVAIYPGMYGWSTCENHRPSWSISVWPSEH